MRRPRFRYSNGVPLTADQWLALGHDFSLKRPSDVHAATYFGLCYASGHAGAVEGGDADLVNLFREQERNGYFWPVKDRESRMWACYFIAAML